MFPARRHDCGSVDLTLRFFENKDFLSVSLQVSETTLEIVVQAAVGHFHRTERGVMNGEAMMREVMRPGAYNNLLD